jgi:hypothetical protein
MGAVIKGAVVYQEARNESDYRYDILGKNSEVFTGPDASHFGGDLVQVSSGVLKVGTSAVVGVIAKTATMSSTNQTAAKVYPAFIPVAPDTIFLMGTNADLTGNATDGGTYYGVTGATGNQQVDVTTGVRTGSARTVEIVKVDPFNIGGTGSGSGLRQVLVRIVNTPYSNVNITA